MINWERLYQGDQDRLNNFFATLTGITNRMSADTASNTASSYNTSGMNMEQIANKSMNMANADRSLNPNYNKWLRGQASGASTLQQAEYLSNLPHHTAWAGTTGVSGAVPQGSGAAYWNNYARQMGGGGNSTLSPLFNRTGDNTIRQLMTGVRQRYQDFLPIAEGGRGGAGFNTDDTNAAFTSLTGPESGSAMLDLGQALHQMYNNYRYSPESAALMNEGQAPAYTAARSLKNTNWLELLNAMGNIF